MKSEQRIIEVITSKFDKVCEKIGEGISRIDDTMFSNKMSYNEDTNAIVRKLNLIGWLVFATLIATIRLQLG